MQIELIGCTGAGKSSLLNTILQDCHSQGVDALTGDEYVLRLLHLNWIKYPVVRTLFIDFISLSACLLSFGKYFRFYNLTIRIIRQIPSSEGWFKKTNIARNVFKKTGIYEIIRRHDTNNKLIFIDEGTIHSAHNFFVHVSGPAPLTYFSYFIHEVPQPDIVIYLKQDKDILIKRTLARGHKRIPTASVENVQLFIEQAIEIFSKVENNPILNGKLIKINSSGKVENTIITDENPSKNLLLKIIKNIFIKNVKNKTEQII